MKRFILIFAALLIGLSASAQIMPTNGEVPQAGMKYRELKKVYNYKDYVKYPEKRYSPAGAGIASFSIPGLGEMICGGGWRGAAFLGGWLAGHVVAVVGIYELSDAIYYTGVLGSMATRVISAVDASRVAKVKNMYYLYPSMSYVKTSSGIQPTPGLTFAINF